MTKTAIELVTGAAAAPDRLALWERVFSGLSVRSLCEVGVFRGAFAAHILGACPSIEHYWMIDPWRQLPNWQKPANKPDKKFAEIHEDAMARTAPFASKRYVLREETKAAAPKIPDGSLDAVYIDGDHTLRGITIDLVTMLPKVRPGGIIGGDDFVKNIWQHGPDYAPTEIFPFAVYFAEAQNLPIVTLPHDQFCIINDPGAGFALIDEGGYAELSPREIYALPKD